MFYKHLKKYPIVFQITSRVAAVVLICLLAGCGNFVEVRVNPAFTPQEEERNVVVLEFTHPVYKDDVADSVTFGQATSSQSGDIVADILATTLEDSGLPGYVVMPRDRLRETLKRAGIQELGAVERDRLGLAKLLDANTFVVGNVERFQSGFFLMVSAATVAYSARCLDAATGQEMWAMRGKLTRLYDYEDRLAAEIAKEAVKKLKEALQPPPRLKNPK